MADSISNRRDTLPPLSKLDLEKVKRETSGYNHHTSSAMNPPLVSPSTTTYSGPPPPYSYPSSTSSSVLGGVNGPPSGHAQGNYSSQSRQASIDDKEHVYHATNHPPKHTLPPISSIQSILTTNAPPRPSLTSQSPTSPTYRSDQESRARIESYQRSPPRDSKSYEQQRPAMNAFSPSAPNHYNPQSSFSNHSYNTITTSQPPHSVADLQPISRPAAPSFHQTSHASPVTTVPPTTRNEPTSHPTPTFPYPAAYSYPPSTPGVSSYQAPTFESWRNGVSHADQERAEEVRKAIPKDSPPHRYPYGERVKRQLDIFDLETCLNEIADGSGRGLDFARLYRTQAHNHQRSGPTPASLPTLADCDEIIAQQERTIDSMKRLRELIWKQHMVLNEQRKQDQQVFKLPDDQESHHYADRSEGGGGFAGADPKKRRGRAAPPGRCHSCNRAETPEWRRGPDGARTLCNACGLHYAKVTRRLGNKGAAGSSNLRPKEDTSSP